ncbi:hypothetical protein B8W68_12055 [Mycobacterium paraintracellulare]|nr:hypothetical protein B8W68_12055 [Mycobacterium paraintracellulare]
MQVARRSLRAADCVAVVTGSCRLRRLQATRRRLGTGSERHQRPLRPIGWPDVSKHRRRLG